MHLQHFVPTDRKKLKDGQEKYIAIQPILNEREKRHGMIQGKADDIA